MPRLRPGRPAKAGLGRGERRARRPRPDPRASASGRSSRTNWPKSASSTSGMTSRRSASISASCVWLWIPLARSSSRNESTEWLNRRNPPLNLFPQNRQDVDATFHQDQVAPQGSQARGEALRRATCLTSSSARPSSISGTVRSQRAGWRAIAYGRLAGPARRRRGHGRLRLWRDGHDRSLRARVGDAR